MFGLGGTEILVIIAVVAILFGLGKLPDVARTAGSAYRTYRDAEKEIRKATDPRRIFDLDGKDDNQEPK